MAALIGALRATLSADTARFEQGMQRARREAATTESSIKKSLGSLAATARAGLAGLASGLSVGLLAQTYLAAADAAAKLDAQLRLATMSSGNFARAQQDVARIAQETRTGLVETAGLYATFQRSALELGITQEQSARATETVSKAFQISGASAAEAAGGLRQFLQGIQSGTLRGEELNSVLENAPRLAKLVAESLGVTIGELRKMGAEGEITGDKLIRALTDRKFTDGIDKEFKQLPVTFDQAMTQVRNASIITFGAFDQGGEFSKALSEFISSGADGFADLAASATTLGIEIRATFEGLGDAFEPLLAGAKSVFGAIASESQTLRDTIAKDLRDLDALVNLAQNAFYAPANLGRAAVGQAPIRGQSNLSGRFVQGFNRSANDRRLRMLTGPQAYSQLLNEVTGGRQVAPPRPRVGGGGGSGRRRTGGGGRSGPSAASQAAAVERDRLEALRDAFRATQEIARAEMDVLRATRDLATDYVERNIISIQILDAERRAYVSELEYEVASKEKTQAQADSLLALYDQKDALERQGILAEEQVRRQEEFERTEQLFADLQMQSLQARANLAETASERRAIEIELLRLAYEEKRRALQRIVDETKDADERNRARMELAALPGLQRSEEQGVIASTRGPMEDYLASLPNTAAKWEDALQSVRVNGLQSLEDGLVGVISGTQSLADAFSDMTRQILADLARIMIQKALSDIASSIFGGMGGGFNVGAAQASGAGALGALSAMPIPGFATSGGFNILGNHGRDRNILSMNGLPIARVSHGERISVDNDNGPAMGTSPFVFNNYARMSPDEARRTGMQAATAYRQQMARSAKQGF